MCEKFKVLVRTLVPAALVAAANPVRGDEIQNIVAQAAEQIVVPPPAQPTPPMPALPPMIRFIAGERG